MWYGKHWAAPLLAPVGHLYCALAAARREAYRKGWLKATRLPVPVIVVGNISVGGTGKTPLVLYLVAYLRQRGLRPGVVSRGYGGQSRREPRDVGPDSDPYAVGDEPVLIARRTGAPVVVAPDRVAAGRHLLARHDCDVLVADDGLQHYALARDLEIAVVDVARGQGRGRCLPAGPLREPPTRLASVDLVINREPGGREPGMRLHGGEWINLADPSRRQAPKTWQGRAAHVVAGIGCPERFFAAVQALGCRVHGHAFPDHHRFEAADLAFGDDLPVLMTEKDAVKCRRFARADWWYRPLDAELDAATLARLETLLINRGILSARAGAARRGAPGAQRDPG
ncbi:MAG TPA: tetraacyldisaccharide 4'-kinase [Gammaproteobacteria bacterium]|nr:tetraacyldisaccharide 4'-kinase [Gammaproteobacteria bacterium]